MMVEDFLEPGAVRCWNVQLTQRDMRIASRTVWKNTLSSCVDRIPGHAAVEERVESPYFEKCGMDSEGRTSTRLARLSQVNQTVARGPTEFRFL